MRTNRTCNLVLVLLLIGARLPRSRSLPNSTDRRAPYTAMAMAMAMAMVGTDDDVGRVRGGDS